MHTFNPNTDTGNHWFHNGDFSGDVQYWTPKGILELPFQDILALVHEYENQKSIAAIEALIEGETVGQMARRMSGAPEYMAEHKTDEDRTIPAEISERQRGFYMGRFLDREKSSAPDHKPPVRVPVGDTNVCPNCRWDVDVWNGHHSTCPDFQQPETD